MPVHMIEAINKVNRAQRKLTQDLGREPTELGVEVDTPVRARMDPQQAVSLDGDDLLNDELDFGVSRLLHAGRALLAAPGPTGGRSGSAKGLVGGKTSRPAHRT